MPDFQHGNDAKPTLVVTQPPHFPTMHTRDTVTHLAAFGLDDTQIAVILRCTTDDVRRYYSEEVEHGLARINARVMAGVLHAALYENSAADRKLWLINKAGWKSGDGNRNLAIGNMTNPDGSPVNNGELTVIQRREVITKLITTATQRKRQQERVIEAEVTPVKKNGGTNGSNGNGAHK